MTIIYDIVHNVFSIYFHMFFNITKLYFSYFNSKYKIQHNNKLIQFFKIGQSDRLIKNPRSFLLKEI